MMDVYEKCGRILGFTYILASTHFLAIMSPLIGQTTKEPQVLMTM